MKQNKVKKLVLIAVLGALSGVLMTYLRFPLPLMPPFMDFDFAAIPEIIGGFALGPMAGAMIVVVKLLVKLVLSSTSTLYTGELSNLILSISYVVPAAIIYRKMRTKKGAILGLAVGTLTCTVVAVLSNVYFILPFYAEVFGMPLEDIIAWCATINPAVTDLTMFVLVGVVPFNLIKFGVCSLVAVLIYKRVSPLIKRNTI